MKKRLLAILLAASMVLSLVGCGAESTEAGSNASTSEESEYAVLDSSIALSTEEVAELMATSVQHDSITIDAGKLNINPVKLYDSGTELYSMYEMLFQVAGGLGSEMRATLADADRGEYGGYDHEEGSNVYTFYICDNIYDHDGNHFTASDAAFSFEMTKEGGQVSGWDVVESWEAVDETTLVMTCTRELTSKGELENIVLRCFMFTEQAYNDHNFTEEECGTGPYALSAYESGAYVKMEKYDNYWQTDTSKMQRGQYANVNTITVQYVVEDAQKVAALETGAVDMSQSVPPAYIETIKNDGLTLAKLPGNDVAYLEANMSGKSPLSDDINLRLAIFYAVSSADAATVMGAVSNEAVYCLGSSVFPDYNDEWETWDNYQTSAGNLALAKEYLEKSNYNGEELVILCISEKCAQFIQQVLQNIGIDCSISKQSSTIVPDILSEGTDWDLYLNSGVRASDYVANLWSHVMNGSAFVGGTTEGRYDSEEYQQLLQNALQLDATQDDMDAFWQATVDNALVEGLYSPITYIAYDEEEISSLWLNDKSVFLPGAFVYTK
ncbi:MAG: ABC transporter substrate-binding protein [Oscillospiraceae bacterium]|nr:ABC transporter substrate-binding protein [Oscillospiraceae bacterium]